MPDPVVPAVWVLEASGPALVLGSSQSSDLVDLDHAELTGVDVVSRRSGGGAVLVVPHEMVWVDVFLPSGDPLWTPDVGQAFLWLGQVWSDALAALGIETTMHTGGLARSEASDLVCFAGRGPGELFVTGSGGVTGERNGEGDWSKVVGMSQRRTRSGARFQCAAVVEWNPWPFGPLLGLNSRLEAQISTAGAGLHRPADTILESFLAALKKL